MDRIRMPLSKSREVTVTFRDAFREFVVDATARGLSPKTIRNFDNFSPLAFMARQEEPKRIRR